MVAGKDIPLSVILACLLGATILVTLLVYWLVICRALYKEGASFPTGLMFWRAPLELRAYRDIAGTQGRSPTAVFVLIILLWFNILLTVVLVLRVLYERSEPFG